MKRSLAWAALAAGLFLLFWAAQEPSDRSVWTAAVAAGLVMSWPRR